MNLNDTNLKIYITAQKEVNKFIKKYNNPISVMGGF